MNKVRKQQAIFALGFSESREFASYLKQELSNSENGLYHNVYIAPLGESLSFPHGLAEAAKDSDLITHSAGLIAVSLAVASSKSIIALNAPERNTLAKTIIAGLRVGLFSDDQPEDHVKTDSLLDPGLELLRYPLDNVKVPLLVRNFSAAEYLSSAESIFPEGRTMIQTTNDQFGFTRSADIRFAVENGVNAWEVPGLHNRPMFQPQAMVQHIRHALYGEQPPALLAA